MKPRLFRVAAIILLIYLTFFIMPVTAELASSPWPKSGYDLNNTGQSPFTGSQSGTPKWSYNPNIGFQYQSPVIGSDGTIYYGDKSANLRAINTDGTLKWIVPKTMYGWGNIYGPVAIGSNDILYFGDQDTYVYAVYASDGTKKWKSSTSIGVEIYGSPTIGADGTIYVASDALYAFDSQGTLKWKNTTGTANYATPAIGPDGTIYIGSQTTSTFYAYNSDGILKWSNTSGAVKGSAAIGSDGTTYIGSSGDSNVYAWNPDGTLKWKNTSGALTFGSPAIAKDGTIYVGGTSALYAWNRDGTLKWSYNCGKIYGAPVIGADGTIYFITWEGNIYGLTPDAILKWSYKTANTNYGSPAISADGTVYASSFDRRLRAFPGVVTFTADQIAGPAPLTVQFTGTSPLTVTAWHWDFGDGVTSDEQNPPHTYSYGGVYSVNLTITNSNGMNTLIKTKYISVYSPPTAAFTATPVSGKSPLSVSFTDQSTGAPTSWYWEFGDGTTSTEQNPVHIFTASGSSTTTYTVNLTATNSVGTNTTSKTDYITPYSTAPVISFTASPRVGVVFQTIQFNDISIHSPTAWLWDFGDGTTSTDQNPTHTYSAVGNYSINLSATNVFGTSSRLKNSFIDIVTPGPIDPAYPYLYVANDEGVKFDLNGTNPVYVPNTYSFATMGGLNALHISSGNSVSDITTTTNQSGTFYFTHTGGQPTMPEGILMLAVNGTIPDDFRVHIRSSGDNWTPFGPAYTNGGAPTEWNYKEGAVDQTFTKDDFIYGPQSWKPDGYPIYYGEDQADPINQFRIMFIDLNAGKAYHNIKIEYAFTNLTSFAVFNAYGWYLASSHGTMIMTNDVTGGSTYGPSGYSVIGIPDVPKADFTRDTPYGWHNRSPIRFTDITTNVPQSWHWDFGDGTSSFDQNVVHMYTNAGTYTVNLTVTNVKGTNSRTQDITLTVPPVPVADFIVNVTTGTSPIAVQFNDTSTNFPVTWLWDFGDGTNSTEQNPLHWYALGTYSVNLTVTNGGGGNSVLKSSLIAVASNGRSNQFANPGFETGDSTEWTTGKYASVSSATAHTGSYSAFLNSDGSVADSYVIQYVDLTDATVISFWGYGGSCSVTQSFNINIDGETVQAPGIIQTGWNQYTIPITGYTGVHPVQVAFDRKYIAVNSYVDDFCAGSGTTCGNSGTPTPPPPPPSPPPRSTASPRWP
ncbi:PKD domain-containing protein [Methanoregula sp.]|uniref:PKD domain-containing protein n=1 Tax=Methanoregula sp. TaxID=2052170 RepID=UPI00262FA5A6|nr:PKD domain-containing protein [Methanoregula sp.]MDD5143753.1 PKD domain-containing protein [Methanoregula sp.]